MKTRIVLAAALAAASLIPACRKESPLPPIVKAAADAGALAAPATAGPAAAPTPGLVPPGGSPALQRFLQSAEHKNVARIAREMLVDMDAGKCVVAIERAEELGRAIRAAGGEFKPTLDVRAMARAIQSDPDFMDREYMDYKSNLVGLAVGIEFAPMTVRLSASNAEAQKLACGRFAKMLREIRQ